MLGAGSSIDSFWQTYQFHQQPKILEMLEQYRIGNLKTEDREVIEKESDPYLNEPERNPDLIVKSEIPFNAEPSLGVLIENFITPVENFYGE